MSIPFIWYPGIWNLFSRWVAMALRKWWPVKGRGRKWVIRPCSLACPSMEAKNTNRCTSFVWITPFADPGFAKSLTFGTQNKWGSSRSNRTDSIFVRWLSCNKYLDCGSLTLVHVDALVSLRLRDDEWAGGFHVELNSPLLTIQLKLRRLGRLKRERHPINVTQLLEIDR